MCVVHPLKGHRWGTGKKKCPARARRAPGALTLPHICDMDIFVAPLVATPKSDPKLATFGNYLRLTAREGCWSGWKPYGNQKIMLHLLHGSSEELRGCA